MLVEWLAVSPLVMLIEPMVFVFLGRGVVAGNTSFKRDGWETRQPPVFLTWCRSACAGKRILSRGRGEVGAKYFCLHFPR